VTFLFTDIEGSTRRWEADANAMRVALAAHDKVLRTAIEAHDGFVFSHSGDGMAAAFSSPMAAVNAAIDAQRELQLPVRMGVATGEAELRDNDYFGTVLNRGARLMTAGSGGQILLADSTAGLLSGIDLTSLGMHRLRDVASPITVYQVRAPGLRADFPPLRTLDAGPGNLRAPATKLVGRESDVARIASAIRGHRMVTLTGVGGVGKTRLALEVAAELADEFPDGLWLFELAAVADPLALPDAVASVLGVTQQAGRSVSESVAAALEGRVRLLIFDNCEHVLDAAADLIEAILGSSATVKILVTSREGLCISHEQVWPVRSLAIDAAAELLVERARSVAPEFSADDAALEICDRLDGIPLAIELAASRLASMSSTDVRDRLDHRFKLLVGSRRGVERHQTLRHAVQWSYDLLSNSEKLLLSNCSVFAGGFDLQSACAVAGFACDDEYAVLDLLDALVRKSLLIVDRESTRTRFSMLETIRQFAEEQLAERGDADSVRTLHTRHFAARETEIMALWDSPEQREAYRWFNVELANLRIAFRWAADRENLDDAATIATYAAFLGFAVENYEPASWAAELVDSARAADHRRLGYLCTVASLCWFLGRVEEALEYSAVGQSAIGTDGGEVPFGFEALLASPYLTIGQPNRSVELCRALMARHPDTRVNALANLVIFLTIAGRETEARAPTDGLLDAAEASHNPYLLSNSLMAYGFAWRNGDPDRALAAMHRGLAIAHESGNRFNESHLMANLAQLDVERGDPQSALDHMALAIRYMHDSGNIVTVRSPVTNLAIFLDGIGHYEAAAVTAGFAFSPLMAASFPKLANAIEHLRDVLGDSTYQSLANRGAVMSTAAMVTYANEQIEQARAKLQKLD
jgi:predicted ATPase